MVDDENNFDEVREAFDTGLQEGIVALYEDTLEAVDEGMKNGEDATGRKWRPVLYETMRNRSVRTTTRDALIDTGDFRANILATSTVNPSEYTAIIGTTRDDAVHHEFGAPEAGIPRRPVFRPAGTYAERRAQEVLGEALDDHLDDAGV